MVSVRVRLGWRETGVSEAVSSRRLDEMADSIAQNCGASGGGGGGGVKYGRFVES